MPLLAIAAVMLCTAMVLIVWSVMAGFLTTLLDSGKTLMGDVEIEASLNGLPYYEDLRDRLEADPAIAASSATVKAQALLGVLGGSMGVQVIGIDGPSYHAVTGFGETLWWRHLDEPLRKDLNEEDLRLKIPEGFEEFGLHLTEVDRETGANVPAVVLGINVANANFATGGGWIVPFVFMPQEEVTLTVLPISRNGAPINVQAQRFPVANEMRTRFYEVDANFVLIRRDALQELLRMDEAQRIEDGFEFGVIEESEHGEESFSAPRVVGVDPARVSSVLVRAAEGVSLGELKERVRQVYAEFVLAHDDANPKPPDSSRIIIQTWDERPGIRNFVQAVKKETALLLALFAFISLTAVFLVCAIFWSMVSEKTKDIGVLRALGASRLGVAWLFLRYGTAIGVVGSILGGVIAVLIVRNINPIHEWIGRALGIVIWDPEMYLFADIPNQVEPTKAAIVLGAGVLFSVLGALLPAARAASLDPVRSLRFE